MKNSKELKDFKIEELEQRLEMNGDWDGSSGNPTATGDVNWGNVAIAVGLFLLFIIII